MEGHPKASTPLPAGLTLKTLNDYRVFEKVKVLDKYVFPVKYTNKHYDNVVSSGFHPFSHVAYYNDAMVGVCTCRMEVVEGDEGFNLYVMTIGVLAPYRRLGIGARLMQRVIDHVHKDTTHKINKIFLHVQKGSTAFDFYMNFGFEQKALVENYYGDLEEKDAYLLERVIPQPRLGEKPKEGGPNTKPPAKK